MTTGQVCGRKSSAAAGRQSLFFLTFSLALFFHASWANAWNGQVVKVLDGDSLLISQSGIVYEVRLYGVDSPEYKQRGGGEAKRFVRNLVLHKEVTVVEKERDRYGRIVAQVESDGVMLNQELVRAGLAWVYRHFCREEPFCADLERLEDEARREGLGLWRESHPVPPWNWRRSHRK